MNANNELLLTFYGDDLTGSTDALEALELCSIPTILFLEPPTAEQLTHFPGVRAVGLAGISRTMTPDEMEQVLPMAFASLKKLAAPLTHYKVCSTFDSAPEIGSIGRATEIGRHVFGTSLVPMMVGAPKLKRYVVFGNHFASVGDTTYRLDRHPTMKAHPITPMREADLRLHLSQQTEFRSGLIDIRHLDEADDALQARLHQMEVDGIQIVILDTLDENHLLKVGRLIWELGQHEPTFVVGSSGVEFALTAHWESTGDVQPPQTFPSPGPVDQIVAISGSAGPITANQIESALARGFTGIRLDTIGLITPEDTDTTREGAIRQALAALQDGHSVILYAALGPDDPQIAKTKAQISNLGMSMQAGGETLGTQQGLILKEILRQTSLSRCAVAGGDTSGHVLKQLDGYMLQFLMPLGAATPLCRMGSHTAAFDGLEISLKGGQLGEIDFFERVLRG